MLRLVYGWFHVKSSSLMRWIEQTVKQTKNQYLNYKYCIHTEHLVSSVGASSTVVELGTSMLMVVGSNPAENELASTVVRG